MSFKDIETGDIVLFSSNTPTGFLLRTATQSIWNHIGIAIRYRKNKIISGNKGKICILETNSCHRYDPLKKEYLQGLGFSSWKSLLKKYNRIDIRKINRNLLSDDFLERLNSFAEKYRHWHFPKSFMPFLSAWLKMDFGDLGVEEKSMFCSQVVGRYLYECILHPFNSDIRIQGIPKSFSHHIPKHYDITSSPSDKCLLEQINVWNQQCDLLYVIISPILIILFLILILFMAYL